MDQDFLDGIDEQFQRLMKLHGNGKGSMRPGARLPDDRLVSKIVDELDGLSASQTQEVLAFIQTLKTKVE